MKFIFLFLTSLLVISCEKIAPDLERDNPYDSYFEGAEADKIRILNYESQTVVCKLAQGSTSYTDENTINVGDRIYLRITVRNTSNFNISKIRSTFSCVSNVIQLEPIPDNKYVAFLTSGDSIPSGRIGWAEITDGQSFKFAPNSNSYAIEFIVSSDAKIGDDFAITMHLTDELNNTWNDSIQLKIE